MLTFDSLRSVFKTQSNQSKFQSTILFPAIFWGLLHGLQTIRPLFIDCKDRFWVSIKDSSLWNHIQTLCMVHFSRVIACILFDPALCIMHFSGVLACIPADPALCKIHFCRATACIPAELLLLPLQSGVLGDCRRHSKLIAVPESIKMLHHQCRMVRIYHHTLEHSGVVMAFPVRWAEILENIWPTSSWVWPTIRKDSLIWNKYILHEFKRIKIQVEQFAHLW